MTPRIAKGLAWFWAAALLVLSLAPPRYRIVTGAPRDVEHLVAFALAGAFFALAYPGRRLPMLALGIVLIAAVEALQIVDPGRHAYFRDFVLNALGLCAGAACSLVLRLVPTRDGR